MPKFRFLRNRKTGAFAGSIGNGKNNIPTATPEHIIPAVVPAELSVTQNFQRFTYPVVIPNQEPFALPTNVGEITRVTVEGVNQPVLVSPTNFVLPANIPTSNTSFRRTDQEIEEDFIEFALSSEITFTQSMEMTTNRYMKVRRALASNPATAGDALYVLAFDEDPAVRAEVASNAKTPIKCVKVLSTDPDENVVEALRENFELRDRFLEDRAEKKQKFIAAKTEEANRFLVAGGSTEERTFAMRAVDDITSSFRTRTENTLLRAREARKAHPPILDPNTGVSLFDLEEVTDGS